MSGRRAGAVESPSSIGARLTGRVGWPSRPIFASGYGLATGATAGNRAGAGTKRRMRRWPGRRPSGHWTMGAITCSSWNACCCITESTGATPCGPGRPWRTPGVSPPD